MTHQDHLRPGNLASGITVPVAADLGKLDELAVECIDGDAGGTYAPVSPVCLGGQGLGLLSASAIHSVTTARGGRLQLGNNDFPTFNGVTRTRDASLFLTRDHYPQSSRVATTRGLLCSLAGDTNAILVELPPRLLHQGAQLDFAELAFFVGQVHQAVPTLPTLQLLRISTANAGSTLGLAASAATPASADAWYNAGGLQDIICNTSANKIIDTTQYAYYAAIVDETGGSALSGNIYASLVWQMSLIADMSWA